MSEAEMEMENQEQGREDVASCTFKLNFLDFIGEPIEGLSCKVTFTAEDGQQQVTEASTDAEGNLAPIENLPFGSTALIEVKNDAGQYRTVGEAVLNTALVTATAISPKVKISLPPMMLREGEPGTIEDEIPDIVCDPDIISIEPNQIYVAPPAPPGKEPAKPRERKLSQNLGTSAKPIIKQGRDKTGKPLAVVLHNKGDWYEKAGAGVRAGIHWLWSWADFTPERKGKPTRAGLVLKNPPPAPAAVKELIDIATENTNIIITDSATTVLANMTKGKFDRSKYARKPATTSKGFCARYVNIALKQAQIINGHMNLPYASVAGPQLVELGFRDVTDTLPDPRWAAAGDVIVYQWNEAAWKQRKDKYQNPKLPNFGHIDIRSYDDYISDYTPRNKHPEWKNYSDIRIYRKVYDLMPTLRIKAFLHCLREYECQAERDDAKRYQMLNTPLPNGNKRFNDFSKHPWDGLPIKSSGAAGAYQIIPKTWNAILFDPQTIRIVPKSGELLFDQKMQDRIAVAILESRKALASIRTGDIEKAIQLLQTEWTSLPGAKENVRRKTVDGKPMDMDYFSSLFNSYLNEEMKKDA
ncbi:hypothetical protein FNL37_0837 [Methylovorus glucosotrophus]|uniref:hypothetical protein n=1 Tax=Methylovorus glucosotrophus TaxID=266009 RepID=UPI0013314D0F|nr:hypothetical protein [Methylovorus glucosotrophus]KAF0843412.1 hypothetical protein FNL37_0837 [Methylovorus glucosotrophus]